MTFAVVPPSADTQGVFSLLALLKDPDAVAKRLEELSRVHQDIDQANQIAQERAAEMAVAVLPRFGVRCTRPFQNFSV